MYCEGIVVDQEPVFTRFLTILVRKQIPYCPVSFLHVATKINYGLNIIKLLVQWGTYVSSKDIDGNTVIDVACDYSELEKNKIIQLLINILADVNTEKLPLYRSRRFWNRNWCVVKPGEIVKQIEKTKHLL